MAWSTSFAPSHLNQTNCAFEIEPTVDLAPHDEGHGSCELLSRAHVRVGAVSKRHEREPEPSRRSGDVVWHHSDVLGRAADRGRVLVQHAGQRRAVGRQPAARHRVASHRLFGRAVQRSHLRGAEQRAVHVGLRQSGSRLAAAHVLVGDRRIGVSRALDCPEGKDLERDRRLLVPVNRARCPGQHRHRRDGLGVIAVREHVFVGTRCG